MLRRTKETLGDRPVLKYIYILSMQEISFLLRTILNILRHLYSY